MAEGAPRAGRLPGAACSLAVKAARGPAWTSGPIISAAHPARVRFSRTEKLSGTLVWCYQLDPTAMARLTESYQVTRPISRLGWFIIGRQELHPLT